jgi:hypothetical protein
VQPFDRSKLPADKTAQIRFSDMFGPPIPPDKDKGQACGKRFFLDTNPITLRFAGIPLAHKEVDNRMPPSQN